MTTNQPIKENKKIVAMQKRRAKKHIGILPPTQAELMELEDPRDYFCTSCGRPELKCSNDPCAGVIADRIA